jgi:hypothetical protein
LATRDISRQVLQRAAAQAGGEEALAAKLGIGLRVLQLYLKGERLVPDALFLQAVDLILASTEGTKSAEPGPPGKPDLRRRPPK